MLDAHLSNELVQLRNLAVDESAAPRFSQMVYDHAQDFSSLTFLNDILNYAETNQMNTFMEKVREECQQQVKVHYLIDDLNRGQGVGYAALKKIKTGAALYLMILPQFRKQGFAEKTLCALEDHFIGQYTMNAWCSYFNRDFDIIAHTLKKLGYKKRKVDMLRGPGGLILQHSILFQKRRIRD